MRNPLSSAVAAVACAAVSLILTPLPGRAAENHFGDWPEGTSPEFIGTKATKPLLTKLKSGAGSGKTDGIRYQEVVTWYGALTFAKAGGQAKSTKTPRDMVAWR